MGRTPRRAAAAPAGRNGQGFITSESHTKYSDIYLYPKYDKLTWLRVARHAGRLRLRRGARTSAATRRRERGWRRRLGWSLSNEPRGAGGRMLGGWVNPHREQQIIPQGQTTNPPKSFCTPTAKASPDQAALATSAEVRGATHRAQPRSPSRACLCYLLLSPFFFFLLLLVL